MSESVNAQHTPDENPNATFRRLRQRYVQGGITLTEFEEQVEKVYSAQVSRAPRERAPRYGSGAGASIQNISPAPLLQSQSAEVRSHVLSYTLVMALLVGIWAITGTGYFWPVWPMMGWGIGVASHALGGRYGCNAHVIDRGPHEHRHGGRRRR